MAILIAPIVIWIVIIMICLTFCLTIVSAVISMTKHRGEKCINRIPVSWIAVGVVIGTVLLLLLSFIFGGTDELLVNGKTFDDVVWLKVCNMFIISVFVMIVAAVGLIVFSNIKKQLNH